MNKKTDLASLFLRVGLAFVFCYAIYGFLKNPLAWTGYFPIPMKAMIPEPYLSYGFAIYEALLALMLLANKKTFYVALLSAITIGGIVVFNLDQFNVLFRNVAIVTGALALALISRR